ncbi:MAG: lytic transglycosylase domain-containing protein [Candidatus Tectomicrobia bacterium]
MRQRYISLLSPRLLGTLAAGLLWLLSSASAAATSHYDRLIGPTARHYGLEPALVKAVIKCESNFDPLAVSPQGARGLMQLMPATQATLGVADAFHPQHNIEAGTRYLAMLRQTFGSSESLLLAAYNAGPQAVIEAGYRVPSYTETQGYVACVLTALQRYRARGFNTLFADIAATPPQSDKIPVLIVAPLRFSHPVAREGQRMLLYLEAVNASPQAVHGVVSLTYPEATLSLLALHTATDETVVRLSAAQEEERIHPSRRGKRYQLLQGTWPDWQPGQRRTAALALVPRLAHDIALHLSVLLYENIHTPVQHRWSTVLRMSVQPAQGRGRP